MDVLSKGKESFKGYCISWVKQAFDKNQNYSKYIELYNNILN